MESATYKTTDSEGADCKDLFSVHDYSRATEALALPTRTIHASLNAFANDAPLKLGKRSQHREEELANRR